MTDARFMDRALELAARAEGSVSPRPPVGAVVVSDGAIVGEGFTRTTPGPHAEAAALEQAGDAALGATVYVTLEPCSASSVARACADSLVDAGVRRVVVATRDPNPAVDGRGLRRLREAGIDVRTGVRRSAARALVEPFATWVTTGRPFVTLKLAASLDGKVAAADGTSRWISGEAARAEVHELRRRVDAVLVGSGTIEADDPALTARPPGRGSTQPTRVVADASGRTSPDAAIFDGAAPAFVLTTGTVAAHRRAAWEHAGADVIAVADADGGVDLDAGLRALGERGICHVLCEGGPRLAAALLADGLIDRLRLYLAPIVIGGDAPGLFATGVKTLTEAHGLRVERTSPVGDDLRIDAVARGAR